MVVFILVSVSLRSICLLHGLKRVFLVVGRSTLAGRAKDPRQLLLHLFLLRLLLQLLCLSVVVVEAGSGHGCSAVNPGRLGLLSLLLDESFNLLHVLSGLQ